MYKHVLASARRKGRSAARAKAIAAATVNKYRASLSRGRVVCKRRGRRVICRIKRGPRLIGQGGSHRQWYPGKGRMQRRRIMRVAHYEKWMAKCAPHAIALGINPDYPSVSRLINRQYARGATPLGAARRVARVVLAPGSPDD